MCMSLPAFAFSLRRMSGRCLPAIACACSCPCSCHVFVIACPVLGHGLCHDRALPLRALSLPAYCLRPSLVLHCAWPGSSVPCLSCLRCAPTPRRACPLSCPVLSLSWPCLPFPGLPFVLCAPGPHFHNPPLHCPVMDWPVKAYAVIVLPLRRLVFVSCPVLFVRKMSWLLSVAPFHVTVCVDSCHCPLFPVISWPCPLLNRCPRQGLCMPGPFRCLPFPGLDLPFRTLVMPFLSLALHSVACSLRRPVIALPGPSVRCPALSCHCLSLPWSYYALTCPWPVLPLTAPVMFRLSHVCVSSVLDPFLCLSLPCLSLPLPCPFLHILFLGVMAPWHGASLSCHVLGCPFSACALYAVPCHVCLPCPCPSPFCLLSLHVVALQFMLLLVSCPCPVLAPYLSVPAIPCACPFVSCQPLALPALPWSWHGPSHGMAFSLSCSIRPRLHYIAVSFSCASHALACAVHVRAQRLPGHVHCQSWFLAVLLACPPMQVHAHACPIRR